MGSRGTANITRGGGKPKKKSKFSPLEKMERARVGAGVKRRTDAGAPAGKFRFLPATQRRVDSGRARKAVAGVRERYKRNPLPRANRSR